VAVARQNHQPSSYVSGQQVVAAEGDLVILAPVQPVMKCGSWDIHVYWAAARSRT